MRVIGVTEFGGPERLGVHEVSEPHAGPGEVRIRVAAAAVNPTDAGVRAGRRDPGQSPAPWVPGMDAAGVVDEVGEGVPYAVGDELMAIALPLSAHGGAYAEQLVGPWRSMVRVPAGVDLVHAATLPMNGLTAVQLLEKLALPAGATLLVTGAAGILGGYVVQLATHAGLRVIADAKDADRELVRSLGADLVVPRGDDVADRVRQAVTDGVDGIADLSVQQAALLPALKPDGAFASVRGWAGDRTPGVRFEVVLVSREYESVEKLDRLRSLVEQGVLTLRVAGTVPAADASGAHRRLEAGGTRGRLVLVL